MELAVRWNQRSTPADPQFLIVDVAGQTLKHCQVDFTKGRNVRWRELSKNTLVPQFRAFDWHFAHNIVAVGQWSGHVAVLGLHNEAPSLSFSVKTPRTCNSVAFNVESLLATGLERVRSDYCLNVYDVGQWASTAETTPSRQSPSGPLRRLAISEDIVSMKFFVQQPKILAAGVKGAGVRIYDLRDNSNMPAIQWSTSCVHNIAVDPCDANYLASAGSSKDATAQIWDRRFAARQSASMTSHDSSMDTPLLELKQIFQAQSPGDQPSIWSLRYSIAKQGSLGVLGSHGVVRIFETKQDWIEVEREGATDAKELVPSITVMRTESLGESLISGERLRKPAGSNQQVLAFDFLNVLSANGNPAAITMHGGQEVELRQLHTRSPAIATRSTSRASIAIAYPSSDTQTGTRTGTRIFNTPQAAKISEALIALNQKLQSQASIVTVNEQADVTINDGWMGPTTRPSSPVNSMAQSRSRSGRQRSSLYHPLGSVEDALTIVERARRRCAEGYLLDPQRNVEIVQGNLELQLMWKWIGIAKQYAESGRLSRGSVDCNYLGVFNIWQDDIGSDVSARARPGTSQDVRKRIIELARDLELPQIEIPETDRAWHRWLCLYILGIDPTPDVLLDRVRSLALAGQNNEAALHALLARDRSLASIALRSGPRNTQNKALSLLLSIYAAAEDQSGLLDQLSAVIGSDQDPFVQAISYLLQIRIGNDTPSSLPAIPFLPPQYHIALAFSLLSDSSLRSYLLEQYNKAVDGGLVSYIPLTGLSQQSLRIFKRYLNHTGDLQTVVLALSHVCPLYINKPRMMSWRSEYRSNLNRYGLYIKRAQFDMQATRLATRADGTTALEPQKRQISLKCLNCDGSLHREPDHIFSGSADPSTALPPSQPIPPPLHSSVSDSIVPTVVSLAEETASLDLSNLAVPSISTSLQGELRTSGFRTPSSPYSTNHNTLSSQPPPTNRLFSSPRDGTLCPHCGARLPRCAVCEFWIGETDPRSRGARAKHTSSQTPTQNTNASGNGKIPATQVSHANGTNGQMDTNGEHVDGAGLSDPEEDLLAGFVEVCLRCRHVYHRQHARAWFARHGTCAAVGCECVCAAGEWTE